MRPRFAAPVIGCSGAMIPSDQNFANDGTIREKYNVVSGSANVAVATGYKSNVVGFGWTNGVYLQMHDLLAHPPKQFTDTTQIH